MRSFFRANSHWRLGGLPSITKWRWLENVFAGQLAQVASARAKRSDARERRLLSFVLGPSRLSGVRRQLGQLMHGHLMPGSEVEARAMLDAYLDESET